MQPTKMNSVFQLISQELRIRLFWICISIILTWIHCYYFIEEFLFLLIKPFITISSDNTIFLCTQLTEKLYTYITLSFVLCIVFSFPYIIYQIWSFLIPSCYCTNRRKWNSLFLRSSIFFLLTFFITSLLIVPMIWSFLYQFHQTANSDLLQIQLQPKIYNYIVFILRVCLISCICSQIPVILIALVESHILSMQSLARNRSKMLPLLLLIAALITPPDLMCQLLVFFPIVFLLEGTIFYGIFLGRNQRSAKGIRTL